MRLVILWCGITCAALPAPASGAGEDVSNVGRGSPAQYVKLTGRDFSGEAHGDDLQVRIGEIQLESTGKLPTTRYSALGIAVYRQGKILRATWDFDAREDLTSAAPSEVLTGWTFVVRGVGPQCLQGGCEARLQLRVETGAPDGHAEHTDFAALRVTKASVVRKGPPPKRAAGPQTFEEWENWISRAATAISQQRYETAGRLVYEALVYIEKTQGAGRPGAARVRYLYAALYERQESFKQQERVLLESLAILERHTDADVQKAIGTQGGALDKEIVARRLAEYYWDRRSYDQARVYYDRAYIYSSGVVLPSAERNWRLARNSAGKMMTACMRGEWDIADSAMKELKDRAVHVADAEARKQLEYWIDVGLPRLRMRKCWQLALHDPVPLSFVTRG